MRSFCKKLVFDHPRLMIAAILVCTAVVSSGIYRLYFTTDYRVFFAEHNPELENFNSIQSTYSKTDNIVFVLASEQGSLFTPTHLQAIRWLTEQARRIPYTIRVDSLSNYPLITASEDELAVVDLIPGDAALTPEKIAAIRTAALNEPGLLNRLLSPNGKVSAVNLNLQLPGEQPREPALAIHAARALKQQFNQRYPDISVHISGIVALNNAFAESSRADTTTLFPLIIVVVFVLLALLMRSITLSLLCLFTVSATIAVSLGAWGWINARMTAPMASAPIIIFTLAIADCVHILSLHKHLHRRGHRMREALAESLRINFQPILLTSLTTAIGFLSMNFSEVPPFHDLGNIVALGSIIAWILSMTMLPAMILLLPEKPPKLPRLTFITIIDRWANWLLVNRRGVLFAIGAMTLGLFALIPLNKLNDEFLKFFDHRSEFRRATDFYNTHLAGIASIEVSIRTNSHIADPEVLQQLDAFSQWLRNDPRVTHVSSITDTFKRINSAMHNNDSNWYRLPDSRNLAAQYLLLYEMSLPYGQTLSHQLDINQSATRIVVAVKAMSSAELLAMEADLKQWLADHTSNLQFTTTGVSLLFSHISARNIISSLKGAGLALLVIAVIIMVALRSFRMGALSLAPNLTPAGMAFGVWALASGVVGTSLAVVVGLSLGIIVDDSIHFLSKYLYARRRKNLNSQEAVRYAFHTVGDALLTTTLVLVAGFLLLSLASFRMNSDMGLMTAITLAFALLSDFTLLPLLLLYLQRGDKARRSR